MATEPLEERVLRRVPREILAAGAGLALAAGLLWGAWAGLALLAGAAAAAASFHGLHQALGRVLERGRAEALKSGALLYAGRLLLICLAFALIILLRPRSAIAFAAGFSVVIPVFLAEAALTLGRVKSWKS